MKRIQKYIENIIRCAIIALSATFTASLEANSGTTTIPYKTLSNTQIECITRNTYHEARSEGEKGMLATIFVVLNRTKDPRFPKTPCGVIAQPNQFEWYGKGKTIKEPDMYEKAKELVYEVLEGKHKDITKGSLYFNAHHKAPKGTVCSVRIGNHSFYREVKKPK